MIVGNCSSSAGSSSSCDALTSSVKDPSLQALASDLPGVLRDKWCNATTVQYESSFRGWTRWAENFEEVTVIPVQSLHLCLYLISLAQRSVSVATLNTTVASIAWAHKIRGLESPTLDTTVSLCIDGLKRRLA